MADMSVDGVWAAERARCDGLIAGNREALDRLYTDDFAYVHSIGRREERASYLSTTPSSENRFISFTHSNVKVDLIGTVALMTGTVDVVRTKATMVFEFVEVWVYAGEQWKLKYQQITRKT